MLEQRADDEMLAVRTSPLTSAVVDGRTPAAGQNGGTEVLGLVTASIDEATRLSRDLQIALLLITLIGFTGFSVVSIYTARRITNPLRDLTQAAERLGAGDLNTPMRRMRRIDEIGTLAFAFERMRVNVADKQQEIEKLAYWDSLTGLPNRVQFAQAVAAAIDHAEAEGRGSVAVIMLDLDRFKHVNDVLGYRLGDLLLASLADRLKEHGVRGQDMVARLSGDQFAVLLHHGDASMAQAVAARIAHSFETPLELEEHTVDMGAGIGMACWPDHASDAETLLSRAEVAMYTAKRRASGPMMYDASIDASSAQTLSLLSELRHAVEHGELRLFLQPKLGLANGEVVGRRNPGALDAPHAGHGAADAVHSFCRTNRLHPQTHGVDLRRSRTPLDSPERRRPGPDAVGQPVHPRPARPGPAAEICGHAGRPCGAGLGLLPGDH